MPLPVACHAASPPGGATTTIHEPFAEREQSGAEIAEAGAPGVRPGGDAVGLPGAVAAFADRRSRRRPDPGR